MASSRFSAINFVNFALLPVRGIIKLCCEPAPLTVSLDKYEAIFCSISQVKR